MVISEKQKLMLFGNLFQGILIGLAIPVLHKTLYTNIPSQLIAAENFVVCIAGLLFPNPREKINADSAFEFFGNLSTIIGCGLAIIISIPVWLCLPFYIVGDLGKTLQPKNLKGIWFGGDSSGWTHSLSQAAASGLYIADQVLIHCND